MKALSSRSLTFLWSIGLCAAGLALALGLWLQAYSQSDLGQKGQLLQQKSQQLRQIYLETLNRTDPPRWEQWEKALRKLEQEGLDLDLSERWHWQELKKHLKAHQLEDFSSQVYYLARSFEERAGEAYRQLSTSSLWFWGGLAVLLGCVGLLAPFHWRYHLSWEGERLARYVQQSLQGRSPERPSLLDELGSFAVSLRELLHQHGQHLRQLRRQEQEWQTKLKEAEEERLALQTKLEARTEELATTQRELEVLKNQLAHVQSEYSDLSLWHRHLEGFLEKLPHSMASVDLSGHIMLAFPPQGPPFGGKVGRKWFDLFENAEELVEFWEEFLAGSAERAEVLAYFEGESWELHWRRPDEGKHRAVVAAFPVSRWEEFQHRLLFFEESLHYLPHPLWICDGEGHVLFENAAAETWRSGHTELWQELQPLFQGASGTVLRWQKDKYLLTGCPWFLEGEQVGGVWSLFLWEDLLPLLEEQYREGLEHLLAELPWVAALVSAEGEVLWCNRSFQRVFAPEEEVEGMPLNTLLPLPSDWQSLREHKLSWKVEGKLLAWKFTTLALGEEFLLLGQDVRALEELYQSHESLLAQLGKYQRLEKNWQEERQEWEKRQRELEQKVQSLEEELAQKTSQQVVVPSSPPEEEEKGSTVFALEAILEAPEGVEREEVEKAEEVPEAHVEVEEEGVKEKEEFTLSQRLFQITSAPEEAPTRFFLGELLNDMEDDILDYLGERQNAFEWDGDDHIWLYTKREALRQLLMKMIVYASKHTYSGKIRLIGRQKNRLVFLTVEDNGPIRSAAEMALLEQEDLSDLPDGPIVQILREARALGAKVKGESTPKKTRMTLILQRPSDSKRPQKEKPR